MDKTRIEQIITAQPVWYPVFTVKNEPDAVQVPPWPIACWGLQLDEGAGYHNVVGFWPDGDGILQNVNEDHDFADFAYVPDGDVDKATLRKGFVRSDRAGGGSAVFGAVTAVYERDEQRAADILKGD